MVITRVSEIFANKSDIANMTMEVFTVNFPDGGAFSTMAIFVDQGSPAQALGTSGRVYIITRSGAGQLFFVDLPSVVTPTATLEFTDTGVNLGISSLEAADITSDGNLIGARGLPSQTTFFWTRPCETVERSMAQLSCPGDNVPLSYQQGETFAFGTSAPEYDYFMFGWGGGVTATRFYRLPATPSNPNQSCALPQTTPSPDPNTIETLLSNGTGQEQLVVWYANYVSVPPSSVTLRNPPGVAFDLLQLDAGEVVYYEAENRNLTCIDPDFLRTLLLNMRFDVTVPASDEARVVAVVAQLVSDPEAFVEAFLAVLPTFFPGIQREICNGTLTAVGAVLHSGTTTTTTTTTVPWDLPWSSSQLSPTPPRRLAMLSYTTSPSEFVRFGGVLTDQVLLYRPQLGPVNWTDVTPAVSGPGPRFEGTFAFSPDVGGSLVFGGRFSTQNSAYAPNNVYLLTGTGLTYEWTRVANASASSAPSQRRFHSAVVVQKDGAYMMLIYGGNFLNNIYGGLYAFFTGNSTWQQLQDDTVGPPNYPAPRWGHSAVLVEESYRMIVFAGVVQGGGSTNELWAYDIGASLWAQLNPATQGTNGLPEVRYGQIAVWTGSQGQAMVVASGRRPAGTSPVTPRFWQWYEFPDLNGTWVQFEVRPDPDDEVFGSGVWDPQNLTMYYGFQNGADILWTRFVDCGPGVQQEVCNPTTTTTTTTTVPWDLPWSSSQLSPTPPRRLAMLSYTTSPSEFVRFGGVLTDQVLLYRPQLGPVNWTDVTPAVSGPGPRFEGTFAFSPDVGGSLVFGGRFSTQNSAYAPNNVYLLTGTGLTYEWTRVANASASSAPSQRRFHSAVVVQKDGAYMMLIYGGNFLNNIYGGLYAFFTGNSTWQQLQDDTVGPPNYPAPRWGHSAVLVEESYRMIVFAGVVQGGGSTNELWAYDIGASLWAQLNPATQGTNGLPEVRYGQIAVWTGSQGQAMVVASGRRPAGTLPETPRFWQWYEFPDLNGTWVQFEVRPDPDDEVFGSGVWDPQNLTMYYGFQNGADILWTRSLE